MNTSKTFASILVLFFAFISSANAHFRFFTPPNRGSGGDLYAQFPCGGFNEINLTSITEFPINGVVTGRFGDPATGTIIYSYAPTSSGTFVPVSENITIEYTDAFAYPQYLNTTLDLTKASAKVGDQGVLQAFLQSTTLTQYQCADIKISDKPQHLNPVELLEPLYILLSRHVSLLSPF
ncbi:8143_t:CDS:2 [Funneliformis mosseae]|uniref:8143_t:CDS:1 n=1 Tax=Funneliformis mosseae TaxID=27381 RepID=A0A9N9FLL2_FUNMO|nr:8143_t:CDS:2 [Funneliformis mosseae]